VLEGSGDESLEAPAVRVCVVNPRGHALSVATGRSK
jgi:hypothetical protein